MGQAAQHRSDVLRTAEWPALEGFFKPPEDVYSMGSDSTQKTPNSQVQDQVPSQSEDSGQKKGLHTFSEKLSF